MQPSQKGADELLVHRIDGGVFAALLRGQLGELPQVGEIRRARVDRRAALSFEVFAQGVTVNCVAPGITDTPLMRNANTAAEIETTVSRTGRPLASAEDAVAPFLFLLGEAAKTVSGVTLWMRNP